MGGKVHKIEDRLDSVKKKLREQAESHVRRRSPSSGSRCLTCGNIRGSDPVLGLWGAGPLQRFLLAIWISFLKPKGSGKLGRTDDAGRSSVLAPVLHVDDSSPGFSVGDSVGHTASSLSTGILGGIVEENGRFRPKSVDLLEDCRAIDSRAPITLDAREDKNKGGFPSVLTRSVAAVILAEDDKPGEAGAGLHPGLPGSSFRAAVAGSIPTTAHVVIVLGKQFTYISSVHPSAKWVPGCRQLKCIDGY